MAKNKNKNITPTDLLPPVVAAPVAPQPIAPVAVDTPPVVAPATPLVDLGGLDIVGGLGGVVVAVAAPVKAPRTAGVSLQKTRAYCAGVVVAQHGHNHGITPEMVGEVCTMFGNANPTESGICLRNAWHAVRGYAATAGITLPTK